MKKQQLIIDSEDLSEYLNKGWVVVLPYKHAGVQCGYIIEKLKDNPVPSIDELEKEFNNREDLWEYDSASTVENVFKFLKSKLQNGVETYKEQPNNIFEETDMDY